MRRAINRLLRNLVLGVGVVWLAACAQRSARDAAGPQEADARPENTQEFRTYWPNGRTHVCAEVILQPDGSLLEHGRYTRWFDDGRKECEMDFVRGRKHGVARFWHKNGQVWVEEHYVHGVKEDTRRIWNDQGTLVKEEHYRNGTPVGTWRTWNEKGELKSEQTLETTGADR